MNNFELHWIGATILAAVALDLLYQQRKFGKMEAPNVVICAVIGLGVACLLV